MIDNTQNSDFYTSLNHLLKTCKQNWPFILNKEEETMFQELELPAVAMQLVGPISFLKKSLVFTCLV
jgi:hypothetical protein